MTFSPVRMFLTASLFVAVAAVGGCEESYEAQDTGMYENDADALLRGRGDCISGSAYMELSNECMSMCNSSCGVTGSYNTPAALCANDCYNDCTCGYTVCASQ